MILRNSKLEIALYALQGLGAVFVAIFLAAYLGGLPSTDVLHSRPEFRIPLIIFGAALLALVLAIAAVRIVKKKSFPQTYLKYLHYS
jgi:hypothetical protein